MMNLLFNFKVTQEGNWFANILHLQFYTDKWDGKKCKDQFADEKNAVW